MKEVKDFKSRFKRLLVYFFAALVIVGFFASFFQKPWQSMSIVDPDGTINYIQNPWTLSHDGEVIKDDLILPDFMELEQGEVYTLTTTLAYDGSKDEMPYGFYHIDHVYTRIYIDDELVFSYFPEDLNLPDKSKSPGFIYKAFALPNDCKGVELKIELLPMFKTSVEYGLPDIVFGDFQSMLRMSIDRDLPHDIVIVLAVLLGLVSVLFSSVILKGSEYREGMSIGIFSLLFALYLFTECNLNYYYLANPYYIYLLNYIPFSLLPIALMGFMRERLLRKQRSVCTGVIVAELIFVAIELFMHFNGILDMRELIPAIHLIYFAEIILIAYFISMIRDRKKKNSLVIQLMPVMVGMLLDVLIYWLHWQVGGNDATFTIFGVIVFMIIEVLHVWNTSLAIYTKSIRSNVYRQMAYVDELTGVGNRRAFDLEIDNIKDGKRKFESMIVASIDINDLKMVNDNFGHAEGDKLITDSVDFLRSTIKGHGNIFRTGGDEFSIFLYNKDLAEFEKMIDRADKYLKEKNKTRNIRLSMALGYIQIFDNNILEAVITADKRMYADKAKFKQDRIDEASKV